MRWKRSQPGTGFRSAKRCVSSLARATLRKVDQQGLIANAGSGLSKTPMGPGGAKVLVSHDLSEMFGIEMASAPPARATGSRVASKRSSPAGSEPSSAQTGVARPSVLKSARLTRHDGSQGKRSGLTPATRRALSERMRETLGHKTSPAEETESLRLVTEAPVDAWLVRTH
jgi:hypothetical protein